ncbi:potassium transporter peripheral membrane component [Lentisphaera araneosa HTCC2155]|jgi:hypothetical protein|uniref:Potassium transporter peripheral membrane component n=1 Tax=Lentisphaera araneosa HTCC2155 TaxID=313628 RepID=A6DFY5_9BACT|nr:DUF1737 domain-containing protein [Lentisphaera araneosa]EDM29715.1 potassium transporter peripheral membrane component [Lentisphaera araneosa HTCC2155]
MRVRVKDYKVVFNVEGEAFDNLVTECLNDGWELYGNPWAHQESGNPIVTLYQAISRDTAVIIEGDDVAVEE